jgi:hypothetical protein
LRASLILVELRASLHATTLRCESPPLFFKIKIP